MATQKQRGAARKPVQFIEGNIKSRRGGKKKTNFESLTKENASSARAGSREG
jgi:hypothetical protein